MIDAWLRHRNPAFFRQLDGLGLDEEARALFVHGNATRVFRWAARAGGGRS
ncbi:MAG: hypothetical protein H6738_24110 [Alphaproteobacteria bacterium]|nr:hypothetical protein [Alphaproteobacteria bacterium]MCB9699894.1 hypothetical protein [Alphaproteobacteria bacterium]